MELTHSFAVPAPLDQAWATFMDLELVGGCFPGATVTEVTDEGFTGTVKVKLGPIALVYAGSGTFVERDDSAHRAVIEAMGKDRRGNGTAGATVTIALSEAGDGGTQADVRTDLSVTGKPAQFGRGVMQDVSDKLLGQFVACIEGRFTTPAPEEAQEGQESLAAAAAEVGPTAAAPAKAASADAASADAAPDDTGPADAAPAAPRLRAVPEAPPSPAKSTGQGDALDLGATVLPVLVKSYGKQVLAGLVALAFVLFVVSRRRRRRSGGSES